MSKPFPGLDQLQDDDEIKPTETYVLDDAELVTLEDTGMTGILRGLSETTAHTEIEVPYDFEPTGGEGAWVSEDNVHLAVRKGYELYKRGASFYYRRSPMGAKEYLLRKPPDTQGSV